MWPSGKIEEQCKDFGVGNIIECRFEPWHFYLWCLFVVKCDRRFVHTVLPK